MTQTKTALVPDFYTSDFLRLKKEGRAFLMEGDYSSAEATLQKALVLEPDAADVLYLLGRCMHSLDRYDVAAAYLKRSIELSEHTETYNALIEVYLTCRQADDVLTLCDTLEKKNIANYDTWVRKGLAQLMKNDIAACLNTMVKAVELQPQHPDARSFISGAARNKVPAYNEHFKSALQTCLQSDDTEHNFLASAWFQQLRDDPNGKSWRALQECADYDAFAFLYANPQNRAYILTPFFRLGVEKLIIPHFKFERFLTHLRRFYLESIVSAEVLSVEERAFLISLGIHCFLNEFCFAESREENAFLDIIQRQIEHHNGYIAPDDVAIFAAYRPLASLKNVKAVATNGNLRRLDTGRLIAIHIDEPALEESIKKDIQSLVPIEDSISRAVQNQYEENPYPRWMHCNRLSPIVDRHKLNTKMKLLIAGCGTGKQVVQMASVLPRAEILSVDLSSSSLAYAIRKAKEYYIDNVTFRQGDILNLGQALEKNSFDRIECTGVLHHMKDPMAGWRVLTDLLKPGGIMTIGLYSEFSRRGIVEARNLIQEKGFNSTLEGIRACRAYMMSLPADTLLGKVTNWRDFYIVSDCRDLIFHVQEHRFTLLQIRDCLKELGLEFVGFSNLKLAQLEAYKRKYPGEQIGYDLEKWHALEEETNGLFFSLYQFQCRKPLK